MGKKKRKPTKVATIRITPEDEKRRDRFDRIMRGFLLWTGIYQLWDCAVQFVDSFEGHPFDRAMTDEPCAYIETNPPYLDYTIVFLRKEFDYHPDPVIYTIIIHELMHGVIFAKLREPGKKHGLIAKRAEEEGCDILSLWLSRALPFDQFDYQGDFPPTDISRRKRDIH